MRRMGERIDALMFEEIEERRATGGGSGTDVLSLLVNASDAQGEGLGNQELRDELMTLLVAGHETTATALTAALYFGSTAHRRCSHCDGNCRASFPLRSTRPICCGCPI